MIAKQNMRYIPESYKSRLKPKKEHAPKSSNKRTKKDA